MLVHKGLRNRTRLTQSSYRTAISETVKAVQGSDSDRDVADEWGVSAGTVANARNKTNDLNAVSLLRLGERFGPAALDTVLSLIGARAVDRDAVAVDVSAIPCNVAGVLPMLIDLFRDGECCADDVRKLDKAGAIDCLATIADMLRDKRDEMRTGVAELRGAA